MATDHSVLASWHTAHARDVDAHFRRQEVWPTFSPAEAPPHHFPSNLFSSHFCHRDIAQGGEKYELLRFTQHTSVLRSPHGRCTIPLTEAGCWRRPPRSQEYRLIHWLYTEGRLRDSSQSFLHSAWPDAKGEQKPHISTPVRNGESGPDWEREWRPTADFPADGFTFESSEARKMLFSPEDLAFNTSFRWTRIETGHRFHSAPLSLFNN